MNRRLFILPVFLLLNIGTISHAQDVLPSSFSKHVIANISDVNQKRTYSTDEILLKSVLIDSISYEYNYHQDRSSIEYPPSKRDFKKLGYNTSLFFGSSLVIFGMLYLCPEDVSGWDKEEMADNGITKKWSENIKEGPIMDKDNFFFNYITHPYAGGVYYVTARSSGFNRFESFFYSTLMSTFFWEYGVEAFAEVPSYQDIVITPLIGSVVGEGFFYAKKEILKHDSRILGSTFLGVTTLLIMDPFNTIIDGLGYEQKIKAQVSFLPAGNINRFANSGFEIQISARF